MKQWDYENTNTANFLVYIVNDNEEIDTVSLGMLTNNKISGYLPMIFSQNNYERYFKYDITSKISIKMFLEGTVNKKRFLTIVLSICKALELCEEYMLDVSSVVLDADHIFVDVSTAQTFLVCIPVLANDTASDIVAFFKELFMSIQFDSSENCNYVAEFLNFLNNSETITFLDIKSMADKMLNNDNSETQTQNDVFAPVQQVMPSNPYEMPLNNPADNVSANSGYANSSNPIDNVIAPSNSETLIKEKKSGKGGLFGLRKKSNKSQNINSKNKKVKSNDNALAMAIPGVPMPTKINDTEVSANTVSPVSKSDQHNDENHIMAENYSVPEYNFSGVGNSAQGQLNSSFQQTTVLNKDMLSSDNMPKLYRFKTNELITIDKSPFKVGKESGFVDYCISDNPAISRSHISIVKKGNDHYVIDTNSTNHTYINGKMLKSNIEYKLEENMRVKLANEEFEFRFF